MGVPTEAVEVVVPPLQPVHAGSAPVKPHPLPYPRLVHVAQELGDLLLCRGAAEWVRLLALHVVNTSKNLVFIRLDNVGRRHKRQNKEQILQHFPVVVPATQKTHLQFSHLLLQRGNPMEITSTALKTKIFLIFFIQKHEDHVNEDTDPQHW